MNDSARLGGFTVIEGLAWASLAHRAPGNRFAAGLCRLLALERINLPFLSCRTTEHGCTVDMAVNEDLWDKAAVLIEENFEAIYLHLEKRSVIASIFPHNRNSSIAAGMLRLTAAACIDRYAVSQSTSALSILVGAGSLPSIAEAVFKHFLFSAYRTAREWKSRRTRMPVSKEIVASYQEKRPKVYSLDWYEPMDLLKMENSPGQGRGAVEALETMAAAGAHPPFLSGGPEAGPEPASTLTVAAGNRAVEDISHGLVVSRVHPVAVFTMNGPHFGDRYGIAGELMSTLIQHGVDLIALACNMSSVTGVVPGDQFPQALKAITDCFDVPSVTRMQPDA